MTKKNTPTDINQKELSSGKFAIDLLPIQNKEDKFSYMTNLAILSGLTDSKEIKKLGILTYNGGHDTHADYNKRSEFRFLQNQRTKYKYEKSDAIEWSRIANSGCLLFQVNKIEILGKDIIITTTDNIQYMTAIEDYLASGLKTLSKKSLGEIGNVIAQNNQKEKYNLEGGMLTIKSKQLLNIGADDYCIIDEDQNNLCILKDNKIATYTYDDDSIDRQSDYFDLSAYGMIKNIRTDINNNFYFIICEKDGVSDLKILNRKTLEEVMNFSDLTEIVYLSNETGKLFCMDKDGYLRIVTINTKNLERGYVDNNTITAESTAANIVKIEDKPRADLKNILSAGGISLSHTTNELLDGGDHSDDISLREEIWRTVIDGMDGKTLHDIYDQAQTSKDIDIVYSIATQLKRNPHIMAVKGLIDPIITAITQKRDQIRLATMDKELREIVQNLEKTEDFSTLLQIKSQLQTFKTTRSQILTVDKDLDTLLKETLQAIDTKIQEYQNEHKEDLTKDIEANITQITEYMDGIDYLPQITSVYNTDLRKNTESMIGYLEAEDRKTWKKKMQDIVNLRQQQLIQQLKAGEKSELQAQEETINEIKNKLTNLKGILDSVSDEETLKNMETGDPLVLSLRIQIEQLPTNKSSELSHRLDQIFKERSLSIQYTKESTGSGLKSLDQYGIPKSLYFVPDIIKQVKRDISGKQTKDGLIKLQFISSAGNIIEPSINQRILGSYKFEYNFEERQELRKNIASRKNNGEKKDYQELLKNKKENKKQIGELEKKYYIPRMLEIMNKISNNGWRELNHRPNIPKLDPKIVITPTVQKKLRERGRKLAQQQEIKKGGLSIVSDKGTGKNFKTEILAYLTNREIFEVSCNRAMEKEDLLFSPEIDSDGTHRKPSKLVQGLQTPGAIIVLDEINTLRPDVGSLLNPLLDHRRHVNDPQVGIIKAHPSVLIISLMNPLSYLGTTKLNEALEDRFVPDSDEYMPAQEEAFMISKFLDGSLSILSEQEFNSYRDEYITRDQKPTDKSIYNIFVALHKVTKVANQLREYYKKTMEGKAEVGKELNFVMSPRSCMYIIQDFNYTKDIKKSIEDIVLLKISDPEQRDFAKGIIDNCCQ